MAEFRGSRKHMYDWLCSSAFLAEMSQVLNPIGATVSESDTWCPSAGRTREAQLGQFVPKHFPTVKRADLDSWWLAFRRGAKSPTWDLLSTCSIHGRKGMLLVEAKANVPELSAAPKPEPMLESPHSIENHKQIARAIDEARHSIAEQYPSVSISRDASYQLSNRIASAWRLADLGVPTVLLYLGFTGDEGIRYVGEPFADAEHWRSVFSTHLGAVLPLVALNAPIRTRGADFVITTTALQVRSLTVPPEAAIQLRT